MNTFSAISAFKHLVASIPSQTSYFSPKSANFVGGQKELTLVTLMQKSAKITKVDHSEHIFGYFSLQASSCIHSYPKTVKFRRKMQIFVGGQNELTLVTLMQKSAKITKVDHSEHIFGYFSLQASSCIHSYTKTVNFRRKMPIFVGGQNEVTLVTLMQKSAKITKFGHSEHIFGNSSLQASSCIHFYPKKVNFRRKMRIFVDGQNELTLVTRPQKRVKFHRY